MGLILVTGATGNVGRRVVSELTSRGAAVRAFVRDCAKAAVVFPGDVEVAVGDFTAPSSLRDALAGVDRVFLTSANGPDEVAHETAVIDATVAASVRLLVKLSALGAQVGSQLPGLDWHGQIEQHLRQSGLPAVVLQSNLFMSNLFASADAVADGALPAPAGDAEVSFVDPADVAAVAAAVLVEGRSLSEPLVITGPAAVSYAQRSRTSWLLRRVARSVTSICHQTPPTSHLPMPACRHGSSPISTACTRLSARENSRSLQTPFSGTSTGSPTPSRNGPMPTQNSSVTR
jgi:uncharacterized protein YbjT (DUF2867 family)